MVQGNNLTKIILFLQIKISQHFFVLIAFFNVQDASEIVLDIALYMINNKKNS